MDLRATGPHLPMSGSASSYSGPRVKIDPADLEKVLIIYEKTNVCVYSKTKRYWISFRAKFNIGIEIIWAQFPFLFTILVVNIFVKILVPCRTNADCLTAVKEVKNM